MKQLRKKILTTLCILFAAAGLLTLHPVTASAAGYKTLYKNFLTKSKVSAGDSEITPSYYYVLNIDQKGCPELIVSTGSLSITEYYVYTVKNGKVKYLGSYGAKGVGTTIYYSKKWKAMIASGWTNFIGGAWSNLFKVSNSKLVHYRHLMSQYDSDGNQIYYYGKTDESRKQVSEAKFNYYSKKYLKSQSKASMLSNTAANRAKSFG